MDDVDAQNATQRLVSEAAGDLLAAGADTLDTTLERVLHRLGESLSMDCVYLFQVSADGTRMELSHHGCALQALSDNQVLEGLAKDRFPWWWDQMKRNAPIMVSDPSAWPPEAEAERELFVSRDVHGVCAFPISRGGNVLGFLGFERLHSACDCDTTTLEALGLLAGLIGSALVRTAGERALEQQRIFTQSVLDSVSAHIAVLDRKGVIVAVNEPWRRFAMENAPESASPVRNTEIGTNYLGVCRLAEAEPVDPNDRACRDAERAAAGIEAVMSGSSASFRLEYPCHSPTEERWFEMTVTPLSSDNGGVVISHANITERKRAELALAEREQQLLQAHTLASLGHWTLDLATEKVFWSDEVYRIFGHEPGNFTPTVDGFYATVHPDDRGLINEYERRVRAGHKADVVHRIMRSDGHICHVQTLAERLSDATGKPFRLIGTVQDVTERIKFEETLIAAREQADRANQAKSEFLSNMSHELRTPMNAILGFGQMLEYDASLSAAQRDDVHQILKAGRHLMELIDEVLDLARIDTGRIDLSLETVEVACVVEECLSLVSTLAEQRSIQISHRGDAGLSVQADRTRLKQALLNLLSNAIKYNREGGRVHLDVQATEHHRLRIRVVDTGHGIPSERLPELFEPFNRLGAETSGIDGTGIGLTLTRRIIELMDGTVEVESEVGVGSTFWIELPRGETRDTGCEPEALRSVLMATDPAVGAPLRVLCIEDNPANIKLMEQVLKRVAHVHLITAPTPELGLELARSHRPALILLDINLPGMDGYRVLETLRAEAGLMDTPVIAITARAMPRDVERGRVAGFFAYLTKPLDVQHFLDVMRRCLAGDGRLER